MKKVLVLLFALLPSAYAMTDEIYTLPVGVIHCTDQCKIGYKIGDYEISATPEGGTSVAPAGDYVLQYGFWQNSATQNMSVTGGLYSLQGNRQIDQVIAIHRVRKLSDKDELIPYNDGNKVNWMSANEIPYADGVTEIAIGSVNEIKFTMR